MKVIFAGFAGLVFGFGLILSGMTNPDNIQNFLDILGNWDPALLFVMLGAIFVSIFAFIWMKSRPTSLLGEPIQLPANTVIDAKLVTGAALFGIGWGLIGFCPGPALVALTIQPQEAGLFVVAMLAGMLLFKSLSRK